MKEKERERRDSIERNEKEKRGRKENRKDDKED